MLEFIEQQPNRRNEKHKKKNLTTFDTILDPNLINVDRRGNTKCCTELHRIGTAAKDWRRYLSFTSNQTRGKNTFIIL